MVDLAADELGIDPAELRRRNTIPPEAMPFKTGLTFTYDCGEFAKNMDMALKLADVAGFEARRARIAQARQAARPRHLQHDRARRRAELRGRRDPVRPLRHRRRSCPAPSTRARATRPRSSRSSATGSASIRTTCTICRATPTRCSSAKAPAARARPPSAARPSSWRPRRSSPRPRRSPRICSRSPLDDVKFADGIFSSPKTNQTITIKEVAKAAADAGQAARRTWSRA